MQLKAEQAEVLASMVRRHPIGRRVCRRARRAHLLASRLQVAGLQDAGCRLQDAGCRMQDAGCPPPRGAHKLASAVVAGLPGGMAGRAIGQALTLTITPTLTLTRNLTLTLTLTLTKSMGAAHRDLGRGGQL